MSPQDTAPVSFNDNLDIFPFVIKDLLVHQDPKKVIQLIRQGFDLRIDDMRNLQAQMRKDAAKKLKDNPDEADELRVGIHHQDQSFDGKIRSMEWFRSLLSS